MDSSRSHLDCSVVLFVLEEPVDVYRREALFEDLRPIPQDSPLPRDDRIVTVGPRGDRRVAVRNDQPQIGDRGARDGARSLRHRPHGRPAKLSMTGSLAVRRPSRSRVSKGEDVVIARRDKPVASLLWVCGAPHHCRPHLPLGDQVQRWIGESYRLMGMQERLNRR